MRVLHVIPAVAARYGGPSTAIWHMTAALAKTGLDVEIATTDVDGPQNRVTRSDLPDAIVPVHLLPGPTHKDLARWLSNNIRNYDIVHTHSLWNRHVDAACSVARREQIPYVMRPCGMLSEYTWRQKRLRRRLYWWAVERKNVQGAATIHATSSGEREDVRRCGVKVPVVDIPLGMDSEAFESPARPNWLREQCGAASGKLPIILFLSRLHPKKGVIDLLLPAFASLKTGAFLAIAGGVDDSTPEYGEQVRVSIQKLGLAHRVALLGAIRPSGRWAAFDGATVFVLPSHSENFGLVVTEAMARGCPVVVTDTVQSCDHVRAADAGLVVSLTPTAVATGIEDLLLNTTRRNAMSCSGRVYTAERLTWDRTAAELIKAYREIARSTPAGITR